MTEETITMTQRSLTKYEVLKRLIGKFLTAREAAGQLALSVRQVRRLKKKVRVGGAKALTHGNTGKESNRRLKEKVRERALALISKHYPDFGPTLAKEKLAECHRLVLSIETVRKLMSKAKLWKPRRRKAPAEHRTWRPRKECLGELVQFDGSYHNWFEAPGGEECLLAAIDDATGKIIRMEFEEHEGVVPVFRFWKGYIEEHGIPAGIYLDSFGTYKVNHKAARDNHELVTQFERAVETLGGKLIVAHSPQAKGRVERLFGTLQDRLVKEMRLLGIKDKATANKYLGDTFIPWFNNRYAVIPTKKGDLHRALTVSEVERLPAIFSTQESRVVTSDFTIRYKNEWFQLTDEQTVSVRRGDHVTVEERLDGSRHLLHETRGRYLTYLVLPLRPLREKQPTHILPAKYKGHVPPPTHPWRKPFIWEKSGAPLRMTTQSLFT